MDLYLIRHAEATPLGEGGITRDSERPLTDTGKQQCVRLAQALQEHAIRLGMLLTSPLMRARQTAEALLQHWDGTAPELRVCDELAIGGKRRKLARRLGEIATDSVGVVGHQPDLSRFAAWLMGDRKIGMELAKAGVALVRCDEKPGKGTGSLIWLVTPEWFGK
jgi:phosphohistidine phosphatase